MPLVLLGLIVFLGIVIYALVMYGRSDDTDDRPVRVKYPHVFKRHKDESFDYEFDDDEWNGDDPSGNGASSRGRGGGASGRGSSGAGNGDGHTMYFPDDAEVEKRKRNIH